MRIFIGLTEVSGFYSRLHRGFAELGIEADFFPLQDHRFGYGQASQAWPLRLARAALHRRLRARNHAARTAWLLASGVTRAWLLLWALARYDVFIMGAGSSFFRFREFWLIRLLGKTLIYTLHGTDSRPAWMDGFCEGTTRLTDQAGAFPTPADIDAIRRANDARFDAMRRIERHASVVVCPPPQAQFLTKPHVMFLAVGLPTERAAASLPRSGAVRILHSPSFRSGKGTEEIRAAIHRLDRALDVEYTEISNRPHAEVLRAIAECDFVVDQVYSDTPMAAFAAEAAIAGKPAVVCGYYADMMANDLPGSMTPPSLFCRPDQLLASIEKMARDAEFRGEMGRQAQEFVGSRWSPREVAGRYLQLALGEIPSDWLSDPSRNRYVMGMGLDQKTLVQVVRAFVAKHGRDALHVGHNARLLDAVQALERHAG